jgi:hypothetical protein
MVKAQALKVARHLASRFLSSLLLAGIFSNLANASELEVYPGAELVASGEDLNIVNRRVILGSLKKINNVLKPKSYIYVEGELFSSTYYIPGERRVDRVAEFYERELKAEAEILFSCQGRDCGSSNFWADSIFKKPILYGPEQYQSYYIGLSSDKRRYVAVYVAQRGTRKIYVHEETITVVPGGADKESLLGKLKTTGRIIFPMKEISMTDMGREINDIVEELVDLLNEDATINVTLVAHDAIRQGESTEDSRQKTLRLANTVKSGLIESGVKADRLEAYGLGPLAPLTSNDEPRLEVLIIPSP